MIDLLNRHFVPVYADGVYYEKNPSADRDETAAFRTVFRDFYRFNDLNRAAGKPAVSVGTVHAYVLTSDGKPFDALHVAQAGPERVKAMLERAVRELKAPDGKPVVEPKPLSSPPPAPASALVLHLTARYLVPRGGEGARRDVEGDLVPREPSLGTERSGQWEALPSEDWFVLEEAEWKKLLPAGDAAAGASWDVDPALAAKVLTRFYPTTENNDLATNRLERAALRGKVTDVRDGVARARLEGELRMKHSFYPGKKDDNEVDATLIGYLDFAADRSAVRALRIATEKATYGGPNKHFGVALRSVAARGDQAHGAEGDRVRG